MSWIKAPLIPSQETNTFRRLQVEENWLGKRNSLKNKKYSKSKVRVDVGHER